MKTMKFGRTALVIALAMTIILSVTGGTIAWFTDEVTSASNVITSGNLDIDVQYTLDGETWNNLKDADNLFKKGLWEPGHTEVAVLKIENKGTLAAKFEASMNIANEVIGKTKAGEEITLSNILDVKTMTFAGAGVDPISGKPFAQETIKKAFEAENAINYGAPVKFSAANILEKDVDIRPGAIMYVAIQVDMAETVGNEANHDGTKVPSIEFGVNVLATQATVEKDSFGNDYDADAPVLPVLPVSTAAELVKAFEKGGNIKLTDDIKLEKITAVEPGAEVHMDLNGKTITVDQATTSNTLFYVKEGGKLVIDGNGTIDLDGVSTMAVFAPYGELVIENGTFIRDKITTVTDKTTGLFMGAKVTSSNVTINGGYFDGGYYDTNAADIEALIAGTAKLDETADDIAKRGVSGDKNLVRVALKDNVSALLNHSGYGSFKVYGGTFVGANPAWGDEGCMLPTTPNFLRPWSYYQGALLEGQTFNENGIVLPKGYTITMGATKDGIPTYTVTYSK